jgi:hypothetical protein
MSEATKLPDAGENLKPGDVADALVAALPDEDTPEARALLEERILPAVVSQANEDVSADALLRMTYVDLRERMEEHPEADRLGILKRVADVKDIEWLQRSALAFAVQRYGLDHSEARAEAESWIGDDVDWRTVTNDRIESAASSLLEDLEAWASRTRSDEPGVWNAHRTDYLHAKLAAQSARSGSFETAAGSLADFLRRCGAEVDEFHVH